MEERVRRLGGELHIDSEIGRGTTVSARLPLPERIEPERAEAHPDALHSHIAG
jgi:signal transduction histidine kinase